MRMFFILGVLFIGTLPIDASPSPMDYLQIERKLAPEIIRVYVRTISGLKQAGSNHLYEAEQISTFLPDNSARCAIGASLGALISSLASGNPAKVAFTATLCLVGGYVQGCCDRYFEIQEHLESAQKCFETAESLSAELARKEQCPNWCH